MSTMAEETGRLESMEKISSGELTEQEKTGEITYPEGGARGWAVALGCAGCLFSTFGYANAFGVFQAYYETNMLANETPSAISWIGSIQIFFLFGGTLFGGPLFDRYGAVTIWPAVIAFLFSVMMTSLCKSYYQFMLAQGILGGIAMGMTMAPGMAATSHYFHKKRAAALGVAISGSSLGGVIFPIALNNMLSSKTLGFGWTVRICGFIMVALLIPSAAAIRARLPPRKGSFFLPAAFKELPFVSLIFAVFCMMLGVFVPYFYLPSFGIAHGMSTRMAFYLTSILNGASFIGRVFGGITADKFGRFNLLSAMGLFTGILSICWQTATSNTRLIVFTVFYGFFSGAVISLQAACFATIPKNPQNIGTYMGMGMSLVSIASLISPPISGVLIPKHDGYNKASIFSGVFILTGAVFIFLVKKVSGKGLLSRS